MGQRAVAAGVPADRIVHEDKARYTIENALFVRRILLGCTPPVKTVALCTDAFHMPRSELIFRTTLEPACRVTTALAPDGTRLLADTGKDVDEWRQRRPSSSK